MARCSTPEEQKKELIFTDRTFPLFSKRDCNHASRQARYRAFLPIPQTPIALPPPEAHRAEKAKVWRDRENPQKTGNSAMHHRFFCKQC